MRGKALRRALQTNEIDRISFNMSKITDSSELISPELAYEMLLKNKNNRPINWSAVERYAEIMRTGGWKMHAQGIILDTNGNILTGQKRLWAVIYSGQTIPMRVSRGNPPDTARYIDRGTSQTSRDLAARYTGRKHSPTEASIARAILALRGELKPSVDSLADIIQSNASTCSWVLSSVNGTKKTKSVIMILAALCDAFGDGSRLDGAIRNTQAIADSLRDALSPNTVEACWNKGAAFSLAMGLARKIVSDEMDRHV